MVAFLLTMIVLSGCIFVGYSLNMYLYRQSVARNNTRTGYKIPSAQATYEMDQQERPNGLRYASIGILFILGTLAICLIVVLSFISH